MDARDLSMESSKRYFTTNGTDIWRLKAYYDGPSCTMQNVDTKEKQTFGMGGLTAQVFHVIEMPEAALTKADEEENNHK